MGFEDLNILYFTNTAPNYIPMHSLSARQITIGPRYESFTEGGRVKTIHVGESCDFERLLHDLPPDQKPDLLIVRTEGETRFSNLAAVSCPKVLLFGNTQHGPSPLRNLFSLIRSQRFDFHFSVANRHHLHWFAEFGLENVFSLPSLDCRFVPQLWQENRGKLVSFMGQQKGVHPYRRRLLENISQNYPLFAQIATREESGIVYANSLVSFNCSLNGDLNLRVFEVLGSGGFLVTDRLSPLSGLETFFEDGKHLVCYDSWEDLREKLDFYFDHPEETIRIARAGFEEYCRHHRPENRIDDLRRVVFEGEIPESCDWRSDWRSKLPKQDLETVLLRAVRYEFIQSAHLESEELRVLCLGPNPSIADLADLPRLSFSALSPEPLLPADVKPIEVVSEETARRTDWDLVILPEGLTSGETLAKVDAFSARRYVFDHRGSALSEMRLKGFEEAAPGLFVRVSPQER